MIKYATTLVFHILFISFLFAQQISHLDLQLHPDKFKAAVTGMGGGDLQKIDLQTGQLSAQGAFEMCFGTHNTQKGRLWTLPIIFRYNILSINKIIPRNEFNSRAIAFVENNQTINIGLRTRSLREVGDDHVLLGPLFDYSLSQFSSQDSSQQFNFFSHSLNLGYVAGILMETNSGPLGVQVAPSGYFLTVNNETPNALQIALGTPAYRATSFAGFGGRFLFQFNDLSFFFDIKKYFPIGTNQNIQNFTDKAVIGFGGSAMGTFLKFKKKD